LHKTGVLSDHRDPGLGTGLSHQSGFCGRLSAPLKERHLFRRCLIPLGQKHLPDPIPFSALLRTVPVSAGFLYKTPSTRSLFSTNFRSVDAFSSRCFRRSLVRLPLYPAGRPPSHNLPLFDRRRSFFTTASRGFFHPPFEGRRVVLTKSVCVWQGRDVNPFSSRLQPPSNGPFFRQAHLGVVPCG